MTDIPALEAANTERWGAMHLKAARISVFHETALRLSEASAKARYQGVTDRLTELAATDPAINPVPWWFVAIVSEREYGGPPHWDRQLGQGDFLGAKSINVPQGMGPYLDHPSDVTPGFDAWTRCCTDTLINTPPFAAKWTVWSIGGALTLFEEYNGLGYAERGVPSAYVWSGTDQYIAGKFVADHVYNPKYIDVQEGCAGILSMMMLVDKSIQITGA
jgi:lysozyme family protein